MPYTFLPIPKGLQRLDPFPLDSTNVFNTLTELQNYASDENNTAYPCQICAVLSTEKVYLIKQDKTLKELNGLDLSGIIPLSSFWTSVYSTVSTNSAINWNYQGTDIKALTGNYASVYSTVNTNSAINWNYQGTDIKALTGEWLTETNTNSLYLKLSGGVLTNLIVLSTLEVGENVPTVLCVKSNSVGINTENPNKELTVIGDIYASGNIIANYLKSNFILKNKFNKVIYNNTLSLDLSVASFFITTLDSNIDTFTIINFPSNVDVYSFTIQFISDGTPRSVAWPYNIRWSGNILPILTSSLNKIDTFKFTTYDGGLNLFASTINQNQ